MSRAFPALGLLKGYRLEPNDVLPDVGAFERIDRFPARVLFWNPAAETWAKHRNPLLAPEIGVSIDTFAIDTLHTLNLGVFQKFLARAWWALLQGDAFGVAGEAGGRRNVEELVANGIGPLKVALWKFYKAFEEANPKVKVNRLEALTLNTLGPRDSCSLNTKAAETRPLLRFTAELLAEKQACLKPEDGALLPAGQALADFSDALRELPETVTVQQAARPVGLLKRYVSLAAAAKVPATPKLHLAMHLVQRTGISKK